MAKFKIGDKEIEANSEAEAKSIYMETLDIEEVEPDFPPHIDKLNLPTRIKEGIMDEGYVNLTKLDYLVISTTSNSEICMSGFKTEAEFETRVRNEYEEPDGDGWTLDFVIKKGKTYCVKPTVEIEYEEVTVDLSDE